MCRSCSIVNAEPGPAIAAMSSIRPAGVVEERVGGAVRKRVGRVHRQLAEGDRRLHRERVHLRAECAQRPKQLASVGLGAEERRLTTANERPRTASGSSGTAGSAGRSPTT